MKLYRVTCRGMTGTLGGKVAHGIAYVVAENAGEAYAKLKSSLDKKDVGFSKDREMDKIELIAEDAVYPDCGYVLYL